MDLLQSVRKEGSRGGRAEFKWDEVKGSSHREHYLGHSLMAPVGRWQKGKDLSWYSKSDDPAAAKAARAEEIRKIKEAEEDAMAAALGLPVPRRNTDNANMTPLGAKDATKQIKTAIDSVQAERDDDDDKEEVGRLGERRGIGYHRHSGHTGSDTEVLGGEQAEEGGLRGEAGIRSMARTAERKGDERRERDRKRERSRSRSPRHHRHHHRSQHSHHSYRHREDEGNDRDRRHRHKDRSRSRERQHRRHHHRRERSYSPREEHRSRRDRSRDRDRDYYRR